MPDEPRGRFVPKIHIGPSRPPELGFTPRNTSGLDAADLVALNVALGRLMGRGLTEDDAKMALHQAVSDWLEPANAAEADIERVLAWR